jgi:D-hexose-6-phosphate mutarotase
MTAAELNRRFGSSAVSFFDGPDGVPILRIANEQAEAEIALYGGQVMRFQPRGEVPVLWNGAEHDIQPDTALRGGIPVCFPWFGEHHHKADRSVFPLHGFVRLSVWDVARADASGALLNLPPRDGCPVRVQLRVQVAKTLSVAFSVENSGAEPFRFAAAFHPYFVISDIAGISVEGLDGCVYRDKTAGMKPCRQEGEVTFNRQVDRIYTGTASDCIVRDPSAGRVIHIQKRGSRTTVVWNPGTDGITDDAVHFGPEEYRGFVCVEAACIGDDAVTLAPGARHELGLCISTAPLLAQFRVSPKAEKL